MKMPILVTGGCGFVGRHVIDYLTRNERSIWVVDDLSTGKHPDKWLPYVHRLSHGRGCVKYRLERGELNFIQTDIRLFLKCHLAGRQKNNFFGIGKFPHFGDVIHLASIVGGRALIDRDPIAVSADLAIDSDFFVWATRAKPKRILYTSSSAAYPTNLQSKKGAEKLKEGCIRFDGDLGQPDMTYGWSKLTGEYLARLAVKHYGLRIACVRPFSGYGEDQDLTYPVPAIADRVARRQNPLVLWGSGKQGRDFVHIDDCVEAMFRALDVISDGSAVNIGSGVLTTFKQVALILSKFANYKPNIKALTHMPTGVHSRYADTEHSRKVLGWQPTISLEEGLGRVYRMSCERLCKVQKHTDKRRK